jgi:hypothetical protein
MPDSGTGERVTTVLAIRRVMGSSSTSSVSTTSRAGSRPFTAIRPARTGRDGD